MSASPARPVRRLALLATAALSLSMLHCNSAVFRPDPGSPERPVQGVEPLSAAEVAKIKSQGFVIHTGLSVPSFHWGYTALFKQHQPMYFTADALLHAVHQSYDHILRDLEEQALSERLGTLIDGLRRALAASKEGSPEARADLDLYLAVAKGLYSGASAPPVAGGDRARIDAVLSACKAESGDTAVVLFGAPMNIDTSMLKPRGHYTSSQKLERYFRSYMFLARTEVRIAKISGDKVEVNRSALEAAMLLRNLLQQDTEAAWKALDKVTETFVGPSDSMSFAGLQRAWETAGKPSIAEVGALSDSAVVEMLSKESEQKIRSQLLHPGQKTVAFLMLGQRYVADSEVLSRTTFGSLTEKRMMPSPLDVGWAIFENRSAKDLLKPELDAYHYEPQLEDAKKNAAALGPSVWEENLYHLWLGALAELSTDTERDKNLPPLMRSEAWSKRMLNTQLASWAELRHDTLLYAKQSFTAYALCAYPDAYVDPYPETFAKIEQFAQKGRDAVALLPELARTSGKRVEAYFVRLGEVAQTLRDIAQRERQGEPLASEHLDFLNRAVSIDGRSAGCTTIYEPNGWYADLYYQRDEALWHKVIVADIHTQPTDEAGNTVGRVLHVGTDKPHPFAVTLESCDGPVTYRGFVSAYRELVTSGYQRLTDEEWQSRDTRPAPAWLTGLGP